MNQRKSGLRKSPDVFIVTYSIEVMAAGGDGVKKRLFLYAMVKTWKVL